MDLSPFHIRRSRSDLSNLNSYVLKRQQLQGDSYYYYRFFIAKENVQYLFWCNLQP